MYTTAEEVYKQLKKAPDELVYEVADFTEFLIKKYKDKVEPKQTQITLESFNGLLKGSPSFEGEPLEIQQRMRNEWD